MPNVNYRAGVRLERLWMNQMRVRGYKVMRSAGSHGLIDCAAWNSDELILVQIKNGKAAYTERDLEELMQMPRPAFAKVYLAERDGGKTEWNLIPC